MKETVASVPNGGRATEITYPGFLVLALGGAGKDSALSAKRQHQAAGEPFVMHTIAVDADPTDFEGFASAIHIALTREAVSAMASNPQLYGPACQAIVRHHPHLVESETLGNGARTHRIITQAAFEFFEQPITKGLRSAVHATLRQGPFTRIQPVFLASLGGGTGSAAAVLLLDYFTNTNKRNDMMLGLPPDLVARPTGFLIDAYTHAIQQHNAVTPDWILSNIYGTRAELAEYEKQGKGYQYALHLGLGNDAGAVFSTIEQVCEANGLLAWEWMATYPRFKSRAVDGLDFHKDNARYGGDDVPEAFFAVQEWPPYAKNGR